LSSLVQALFLKNDLILWADASEPITHKYKDKWRLYE
jgi:hypothetical protein